MTPVNGTKRRRAKPPETVWESLACKVQRFFTYYVSKKMGD